MFIENGWMLFISNTGQIISKRRAWESGELTGVHLPPLLISL